MRREEKREIRDREEGGMRMVGERREKRVKKVEKKIWMMGRGGDVKIRGKGKNKEKE